jgi:hypothetical protein
MLCIGCIFAYFSDVREFSYDFIGLLLTCFSDVSDVASYPNPHGLLVSCTPPAYSPSFSCCPYHYHHQRRRYGFFLASQSASNTWRGHCMWAFEDGGGPALRYGEGVDLFSERSVRVKFQALLSKKDGSYSHSRQHSIGYPIPTRGRTRFLTPQEIS